MKEYVGTWRITEMDEWDNEYINMGTNAHIQIDKNGYGSFQFALVSGSINGEMEEFGSEKRFAFTWEGNEEYDQVSGSGWLKLEKKAELTGRIKFHSGDSSLFKAQRKSAS
jgi:hypothetical protein